MKLYEVIDDPEVAKERRAGGDDLPLHKPPHRPYGGQPVFRPREIDRRVKRLMAPGGVERRQGERRTEPSHDSNGDNK
jgi:hypothetical protein